MKTSQSVAAPVEKPHVRDIADAIETTVDGALARLALWLAHVSAEAAVRPSANAKPAVPVPLDLRPSCVDPSRSGSD